MLLVPSRVGQLLLGAELDGIAMTVAHPNFILILILIMSAPRIYFLFRKKSEAERRYYEVTPAQRWTMAVTYFGLIALLVLGMKMSLIPHQTLQGR